MHPYVALLPLRAMQVLYQTDEKVGIKVCYSRFASPDETAIRKIAWWYICAGYMLIARTEVEQPTLHGGYSSLTFCRVL